MQDEHRQQVISRICRLPDDQFRLLERFVTFLECGDSSPLSVAPRLALPEPQAAAKPMETKGGGELPHSKMSLRSKDWPHAPVHRLSEGGTFIVTAGTLHKEHWFRGAERLEMLECVLLRVMKEFGWRLEAWAVFSNHYHCIVHHEPDAQSLSAAIKQLHGETAMDVNRRDNVMDRTVWHNYWDTQLTFEKSYLARLNYVHQNPVKHGLAAAARQYPWCSAAWFERTATRAQVNTIYRFKIDTVKALDDYEPV